MAFLIHHFHTLCKKRTELIGCFFCRTTLRSGQNLIPGSLAFKSTHTFPLVPLVSQQTHEPQVHIRGCPVLASMWIHLAVGRRQSLEHFQVLALLATLEVAEAGAREWASPRAASNRSALSMFSSILVAVWIIFVANTPFHLGKMTL